MYVMVMRGGTQRQLAPGPWASYLSSLGRLLFIHLFIHSWAQGLVESPRPGILIKPRAVTWGDDPCFLGAFKE